MRFPVKTPPAFSFCMLVTVLHRDCVHAKTASPFSSFLPGRTAVMGFPMKMHPAFSICRDLSYWDSCSFFNKGALPNQSLKSFAFLHYPCPRVRRTTVEFFSVYRSCIKKRERVQDWSLPERMGRPALFHRQLRLTTLLLPLLSGENYPG